MFVLNSPSGFLISSAGFSRGGFSGGRNKVGTNKGLSCSYPLLRQTPIFFMTGPDKCLIPLGERDRVFLIPVFLPQNNHIIIWII